ncbi:69e66808-76c8-44cb-9848-ba1afdddb987-CDS [Sclerotinia trifoliorum]|uniref:69e66808-76c8-44cb-9848-ba1afdddb987-CDS n=1 Tax=Sclerotinia trifoliorum TaxID=28548 RepID=A0A8H2VTY9_9HELO|nr:69e66808-76c8-44cb-9848-ba1afdddb987-CDS [Sclerotinia trifoliorum]
MQVRKPLNLLNDIPREIRDEIYKYAFQTPYNCVTYRCTLKNTYQILPYDPQNDICLSSSPIPALGLLSTCVQLYNEAIISLWKVNSLGLWPADLLFRLGSLGEDAFMHIQSLQVNLDLTDSDDLKWAEMLFSRIGGKWSIRDERTEGKTWGSLKRVQINPMRTEEMKMDVKWMQRISEAMHLRWKSEELLAGQNEDANKTWGLYSEWMELFRKTGTPGNDAYLGNEVKRVVSVNTAWDEWAYWDQNEWIKKLKHGANVKAMEQVMKDLNETFGGELWANGILRYKGDKRLRKVFKMKQVDLLAC